MSRFNLSPSGVALLALGIAFAAWAGAFIRQTAVLGIDGNWYFFQSDDAMIGMRYAWNLAHGQGLVWNPGERVEGFTDLLNVLLKSLFCLFLNKRLAVLAVQLLNIPLLLGTAFLTWRIGRRLFGGVAPWLPVAGFLSVFLYYPLSFWALTGMETGLSALFLLAATDQVFKREEDSRPTLLFPLFLGLAFLARPDALIPAILLLLYRSGSTKDRPGRVARLAGEACIFALFPLVLLAFRFAYFGVWVPNTYTLKVTGIPLGLRLENGLIFVVPFLISILPLLGLAVLGLVCKRTRQMALLGAIFAVGLVIQVWAGGDFSPRWRMLCPFMPPLFLLALEGLRQMLVRMRRLWWRPFLAGSAFAACLVIAGWGYWQYQALRQVDPLNSAYEASVNTALILNGVLYPSASIALTGAGVIPFYTDFKCIDLLGKTDKHVAALPPHINLRPSPGALLYTPGHNRWDLEYSIGELRPTATLVLGMKFGQDQPETLSQETAARYVHFSRNRFDRLSWNFYLLKDSPDVNWRVVPQFLVEE